MSIFETIRRTAPDHRTVFQCVLREADVMIHEGHAAWWFYVLLWVLYIVVCYFVGFLLGYLLFRWRYRHRLRMSAPDEWDDTNRDGFRYQDGD